MPYTMTAAEYQEYLRTGRLPGAKPAKPSKYHNMRTEYNGTTYASKLEADRAGTLDLMVKGQMIAGYAKQVPFLLPGRVYYLADFVVLYPDGHYEIEDTKGVRTAEYRIKKKLMAEAGLEIKEITK